MTAAMFAGSAFRLLAGGVFTLLLAYACWSDLRTRRIPNALVAVLAVAGLEFSVASAPIMPGLAHGFGGLLLGLALWVPFYALGWIGAGDVKLFAAAGAWLGPAGALDAMVLAAVAGGALGLAWMLWQRGGVAGTLVGIWVTRVAWRGLIRPPTDVPLQARLPYGVALAVGAALAGWLPDLIVL